MLPLHCSPDVWCTPQPARLRPARRAPASARQRPLPPAAVASASAAAPLRSRPALHYLPLRAHAEPLRILLRLGGIEYDDITIPWTEWEGRSGGPGTRKSRYPFQQLPVLFVDGAAVAGSGSIARLAAKWAGAAGRLLPQERTRAAWAGGASARSVSLVTRALLFVFAAGLYPADPLEVALQDTVFDEACELARDVNPIFNGLMLDVRAHTLPPRKPRPSHDRARPLQATAVEDYFDLFQTRVPQLGRLLGEGRRFFGGGRPSFGDIMLWHVWDLSTAVRGRRPHHHTFRALPLRRV